MASHAATAAALALERALQGTAWATEPEAAAPDIEAEAAVDTAAVDIFDELAKVKALLALRRAPVTPPLMKKTTEAEASDVEATTEAEAAGQKTEATHGADSRTAEHKTEAAAAEHKQAANEKRGADKRAAYPSWDEPSWQTAWEIWPPSSAVADIWPAASASDADIWPAASASGATAAGSAKGATAAGSAEDDLAGATPASSTDRLSAARESEFYNNRNCRNKRGGKNATWVTARLRAMKSGENMHLRHARNPKPFPNPM